MLDFKIQFSFGGKPKDIGAILMMILFIQSDDAVNPDRMYDLVAVVVHCGSGPNRGHYISIVKSAGFWLVFDDDLVDVSFNS